MIHSKRRPLYLLLAAVAAAALSGCIGGQTGSEITQNVAAPGVGSAGRGLPPPMVSRCVSDADCALKIEEKLAALRAPRTTARRVVAAECVAMPSCSNLPENACRCSITTEGSGRAQVHLLGGSTCAVHGRGLDCLWPAGEQRACTPGTCDCAQLCAEARDLLAADDARAIVANVDVAHCGLSCEYVVQLQDRCYVGDSLALGAPEVACGAAGLSSPSAVQEVTGAAGGAENAVSCPTSWSRALSAEVARPDPCLQPARAAEP
jgi:hypothetical protein